MIKQKHANKNNKKNVLERVRKGNNPQLWKTVEKTVEIKEQIKQTKIKLVCNLRYLQKLKKIYILNYKFIVCMSKLDKNDEH